ncbi:antibiotic biosynthesis monooxygenase [Streptomyces sp. ACA25]|uniref:antibiotic biosynthesis monooxygenase family protein n=1 Tax=Streptomyces sp. ACA25 TaxID=3022596 RepID=UPI0023075021|nr:antibiotic biosynthesis monooxygenase family protein [Streptomyces sp. ACA25]MDB1087511.1 antibiotic biosynthesis monooxygenase [Streptomyces sp. ACA25]
MIGQVLSEVSAVVAPEREPELVAAYRELVALPLPDGLIRTELLRGAEGRWRVQSVWRSRAALEAVRSSPKLRAAPHLFRDAGAEPELAVFDIAVRRVVPAEVWAG